MNETNTNEAVNKLVYILIVILYSSFYIFVGETWGIYVIASLISVILGLSILVSQGKICFEKNWIYLFTCVFAIFCYLSSFWAWNGGLAKEKGKTIIEILICIIVIGMWTRYDGDFLHKIKIVMWSGYLVTIYSIVKYNPFVLMSALASGLRFGITATNGVAMLISLSIIINIYDIIENKMKIWNLLMIPAFFLMAILGSRTSFIMLIVGIGLIIALRSSQDRNILYSAIKVLLSLVLFIVVLYFLSKLPALGMLEERMKGLIALFNGRGIIDSSAMLRKTYMDLALEQFKMNPILGIGIGNSLILTGQNSPFSTYIHNNFLELLACGGIVGFSLFYVMYGYAIFKYIKNHNKYNKHKVLMISILLVVLMGDYGTVSYYLKSTYTLLLFIYQYIESLPQNK